LRSSGVKGCKFLSLDAAKAKRMLPGQNDLLVGSLACVLPAELAVKYGKPLGIV
jgi:hypothetical protein